MDRIFVPAACLVGGIATISGPEHRHLVTSLRLRAGERFLATDGAGRELLLEADRVARDEVRARVLEEHTRPPGPGHAVTLAVAPPKGTRMETAVEKSVECGVGRIVPLRTRHSVVKTQGESARLERWRRVACGATVQSGRVHLPEVAEPVAYAEALAAASGTRLLAEPVPEAIPIRAALRQAGALGTGAESAGASRPVTVFVGPEGGFSPEEIDEGRRRGAIAVTLGPNRLRTETAAVVAVTLVLAALTESPEDSPGAETD